MLLGEFVSAKDILYSVSCVLTRDVLWSHTKPLKLFSCITLNQMEEVRVACPWGDTRSLTCSCMCAAGVFPILQLLNSFGLSQEKGVGRDLVTNVSAWEVNIVFF